MLCYDKATDTWIDKAIGDPPSYARRPAIAFHAKRASTGVTDELADAAAPLACADGLCGQFYLVSANKGQLGTWLRISTELTGASTASTPLTVPYVTYFWKYNAGKAGFALHEDQSLSALKGLLRFVPDGADGFYSLGLADATYRVELQDGDDFQVMERGICLGLSGPARCGASNVFGY